MNRKIKTASRFWAAFILGILLCVMLPGRTGLADGKTGQSGSGLFDIDAHLLSVNDITYDIQLTISNRGEDWEGVVRARLLQRYDSLSCAYDTALSLPQGSTKQFVVRIPARSVEELDGDLHVTLLDKNAKVTADKEFGRFLLDGMDALTMGILSDSYTSLTYLDLGGETIYYDNIEFPIRMMELDQDNLAESLSLLSYLVIDNYNTSVLTGEELEQVRQWIDDGGMLIVGTGDRAEDTLSGLDFLGVTCVQVKEPGAMIQNEDYGAGLETLAWAELDDTADRYDKALDSMVMLSSWGNGAVEIVPYALDDLNPDEMIENWECSPWSLLQNVTGYVRYPLTSGKYYKQDDYIIRSIFRSFGNGGDRLNYGWLKIIVVVYVVFVGPVLYLILRALKRRDWYWWAVPVTVLVGILLVYLAGRGFEVVNTRVYSVTVEKLAGQGAEKGSGHGSVTYLHCYDADYREWGLQLAKRYDYAGPSFDNYTYYYRNNGNTDDKYHYRVCREGERISMGMDPEKGFEDAYFVAGTTRKLETGTILGELADSVQWGITGTVTNKTSRDFECFAVIVDDELYVYGRLPAGETCTLQAPSYTSQQGGYPSVLSAVRSYMYYDGFNDYDTLAALGTGICDIYAREENSGKAMIIGVTKDWDKAVDDDCNETSYGCLYVVQ